MPADLTPDEIAAMRHRAAGEPEWSPLPPRTPLEDELSADVNRLLEEVERLTAENERLREVNESQSYKGNSVHHWWAKAAAYGGMVHGCSPVLAAAGFPVDASQADGAVGGIARAVSALAADRDRLTAALSTAHATGRREGLEEAARVCAERAESFNDPTACLVCAASIRALIPKEPTDAR